MAWRRSSVAFHAVGCSPGSASLERFRPSCSATPASTRLADRLAGMAAEHDGSIHGDTCVHPSCSHHGPEACQRAPFQPRKIGLYAFWWLTSCTISHQNEMPQGLCSAMLCIMAAWQHSGTRSQQPIMLGGCKRNAGRAWGRVSWLTAKEHKRHPKNTGTGVSAQAPMRPSHRMLHPPRSHRIPPRPCHPMMANMAAELGDGDGAKCPPWNSAELLFHCRSASLKSSFSLCGCSQLTPERPSRKSSWRA